MTYLLNYYASAFTNIKPDYTYHTLFDKTSIGMDAT